jgi:heme exporter protein D
MLGAHAGFIIVAYATAVVVVGALIVWIAADHRAQSRTLAEFEARGAIRNSTAKERRE